MAGELSAMVWWVREELLVPLLAGYAAVGAGVYGQVLSGLTSCGVVGVGASSPPSRVTRLQRMGHCGCIVHAGPTDVRPGTAGFLGQLPR